MVQVQSTWFPLIDRNPQTYVPNIFRPRRRTSRRRRTRCGAHRVRRRTWRSRRCRRWRRARSSVDRLHGQQAVALDLTGIWLPGSGPEPSAARLTVTATCQSTPAYWYIEQRGDSVSSWTNPASFNQGIARPPQPRPVTAVGTISGQDVVMSDGSSRYRLRYDRTSGHLRGTLNDKPFWAVPEDFVRPTGCIPAP